MIQDFRWYDPLPPAPWEQLDPPEIYWDRAFRQAVETPPNGIKLGKNLATELDVHITPDQLSTHMHVVGRTRKGKTFLLDNVIKNLILQGQGVCVIDPHGDLYHRLIDFCTYLNFLQPELQLAGRVIPFDVAEHRYLLGFNPIARNARVLTYQVVAMMEAIRKCWGQTTFQDTPRLARWLFNTAYAVIDAKLSFVQTYHMVNPNPTRERQAIVARIQNPRIKAEWECLEKLKPGEREDRVESCLNRVKPFVEHEVIRNIVGQHTNTLDFPSVLAEGKILLVNLAGQGVISQDNQQMLGALLVNDLLAAAFARGKDERRPFFLVVDEFQKFVTKDMCEILDGGRKFGLHLILAHQHLNQLKQKDPEVYYSTLTNAALKVVFGGLVDEDLDILAREMHVLNPDEIKDEIRHIYFEPVESTRLIHSNNWSDSGGTVNHDSITSGSGIPGSGSWTHGTSTKSDWGSGGTEQQVPFYEYHKKREISSRTFRQLEEQLYIKKAQMKSQPRQHATVLVPERPAEVMKANTMVDFSELIEDGQRQEFLQACFQTAGCFKTEAAARREVAALDESLLEESRDHIHVSSAKPKSKSRSKSKPDEDQINPIKEAVENLD